MQRLIVGPAAVFLACLVIPARLNAQDAADYLDDAKAWADKGEYDKAIDDYNQALAMNPKDANAFYDRAKVWEKKGKYDELMADCNEALALNPKFAEAYIGRSIAWNEKGKYDKAIADCNQALAINSELAEAYNNRGLALNEKREFDKAIADCNQALSINPKLAQAYNNRGQAWNHKREYAKAIADCNQALTLNPKLANAYINRGVAWGEKGERDKAIADFDQALAISPDDYNALNNIGVFLWKKAQEQDNNAAKAEAAGDLEAAKAYHEKSVALKNDAKAHWIRGISIHPTATDIHSNLGFAYREEKNLDAAERHLKEAVRLKPISPRPHNNLGRLFLSRSDNCEAEVREAQAKGKSNAEAEANAKRFRQAAIEELEQAVKLDGTLLEARLNLGQVYISLNELDKAEFQYNEVLKLNSENEKDRETINNFSQACVGLARLAIIRKNSDEAIKFLYKSLEIARRNSGTAVEGQQRPLEMNPQTMNVLQVLADQHFQRGEQRAAEKCLWPVLPRLSEQQRRNLAERLGKQCEDLGKRREAVQAWGFMAWALATSPDPHILDPSAAMILAQRVVDRTKQQDPASLDTLAAAQAANGQFNMAVQTARAAITLADSQGNKPLAAAISQRLLLYQQGKPYRCDPTGNDRP